MPVKTRSHDAKTHKDSHAPNEDSKKGTTVHTDDTTPSTPHHEHKQNQDPQSPSPSLLPTPSLTSEALRMSYTIGPGETGVLTFEPYKSLLLPLWRFRTVAIARKSSSDLSEAFDHYVREGDFVGADMARKFLQMGMTRAGRYANYKGGRKYGADGEQKGKSAGHEGREEKLAAKEVFRAVWERARGDGRYAELREVWRGEKKGWERGRKREDEKEGRRS